MELLYIAIALGVIALFAHIVKGLTGFGPAIVFVSIGSIIHDPIEIIVLAALLDIIGGAYLSILNPQFSDNKEYWVPIGVSMIIGAIIGALTLAVFPPLLFEYLLGIAIILIAIWFLLGDSEPENDVDDELHTVGATDGLVGVFSGFCGGFTGMGGPPLIIYLGTKFEKELFRAVIVPIFLMASIARFSSYGYFGMINWGAISLFIIPPIGVIIGNYIGDKFFEHVEQKWFTVLIGIILLFSGIRLIVT
jgi:uncharacterized membrane protein YfcA